MPDTTELQVPCPACKKPVIYAISTQNAASVALDATPSADGKYTLDLQLGAPRARLTSPKLRFGRTNLYSDHGAACGARAGAKSKATRRQGA